MAKGQKSSAEQHTATEIEERINPKTEKVPAGIMPLDAEPKGVVKEDAPVWEGGDPGTSLPQDPGYEAPEQTYWHEGEADQITPGKEHRTPSPTPSPKHHSADPVE